MDCHTELINCIWSLSKENMIQCIKSANVSIGNEVSGRNDMIMIQSRSAALQHCHKILPTLEKGMCQQSNILLSENFNITPFLN